MKKTLIEELIAEENEPEEESFRVAFLLSLSIGILNACTWMSRGHVFASSQSGILLYLGLDIAQGEFSNVIKYLFPPLMFGAGIVIAEHFKDHPHYLSWRRIPMIIEFTMITVATFMPDSWNDLANPIFGLACGLQAIAFRHIHNIPIATLAINGSYQNALEYLTRYLNIRDHEDAFRTVLYSSIVFTYLGGIILGGLLVPYIGHFVSLISAALIAVSSLIVKKNAKQKHAIEDHS